MITAGLRASATIPFEMHPPRAFAGCRPSPSLSPSGQQAVGQLQRIQNPLAILALGNVVEQAADVAQDRVAV